MKLKTKWWNANLISLLFIHWNWNTEKNCLPHQSKSAFKSKTKFWTHNIKLYSTHDKKHNNSCLFTGQAPYSTTCLQHKLDITYLNLANPIFTIIILSLVPRYRGRRPPLSSFLARHSCVTPLRPVSRYTEHTKITYC